MWTMASGQGMAGQSRQASVSPQALGCILYLLCFGQHPFEDGAKLRIVNGKYAIPADDTRYSVFHAQSSPRVARESWGWRSSHCRVK